MITHEEKYQNIARAMELRDELFTLANTFAGEETGDVAIRLHEACNYILRAKLLFEELPK